MQKQDQKNLIARPPVVAIMGHIDHGKSTLLDYIRKSNVAEKESGGITQHIGAYEVVREKDGQKRTITFLDTPGHEAFKNMRSRGAAVADIAILVVSSEEAVKPQTVEALQSIKNAKIPYIVAITKIDSAKANVERAKQSLAEYEIYIEGYGGDVPAIALSAITGQGIEELLDMVLLLSDIQELKADSSIPATGVIIESHLDPKKGISATLIIKEGTLNKGQFVIAGHVFTPVRILENFLGKALLSATFSSPIRLTGFTGLPAVGEKFITVDSKKEAEEIVGKRLLEIQNKPSLLPKKVTAAKSNVTQSKISSGPIKSNLRSTATKTETSEQEEEALKIKTLPIIIKADTTGVLEAIESELAKIKIERVNLHFISKSVGRISENDIKLAETEEGTKIFGFNVDVDTTARSLAERNSISIELFDIIYKLTDAVRSWMTENIPKFTVEELTGEAKILRLFSRNKDKQIIGGKVLSGSIGIGHEVKIMRRDSEIGRGKIRELQQQKQKASEAKKDSEFGAMIESKIEIAEGDKIQSFALVTK